MRYDDVRRAYDSFAPVYDEWVGEHVSSRRAKSALLIRVRRLAPANALILDVGCGTGSEVLALARAGHRVVGVDISPRMLALAREKANAKAPGLDVRFFDGVAAQPQPEWGGPFDVVYSAYGVVNLEPDPAATMRALAKVVRPGGHLIVGTLNPTVAYELALFPLALHLKGFRKAAAPRVDLRLGHGRDEAATCVLPSNSALVASARSAGLDVVEETGIHVLSLPPSEGVTRRFPRFIGLVNRVERRIESRRPFNRLGYFSLLTFRKEAAT